jgi:WXXGXW repeat (2 copies)
MKTVSSLRRKQWLAILAAALTCSTVGIYQAANARQDPGDDDQSGTEVLNRGPIHEAFANPITYDPTPGPVVPKEPSDPIDEQPPDQKPEGDNVQWIPGYWAWDDERTDFIWISGIWREPPPDCQWTPGYWDECDGGWRWSCGCWTPVNQESGDYLPAPPASVEQGPSGPAPSEDSSWAPGYWAWHEASDSCDARYVWSPGCWMPYNPDWLWVSPRYVSTSCGYLFVRGYWDYPIERRGILYAPIYCGRIRQANFVYCPSVCVSTTTITSCLFVRPRCQSYCFGDYFDTRYSSSGIYPWYSFHNSRYGCDPIYAHCAASHYRDREWSRTLHEEYRYRSEHPSARPPRTYNETLRVHQPAAGKYSNLSLTMPVHRLAEHQKTPIRMTQVGASERKTFAESGKRFHQVAYTRRNEERGAAKHASYDPSHSTHLKLTRSHVGPSGSTGVVREHPGSGTQPGSGSHPGSGTHPGAGTHPAAGTHPGSGTHPGTGTHPAAGTHTASGTHPGSGINPGSGVRENHSVQRPVFPARQPGAPTTRKSPPPHPSYPKADHSVKAPPSHYTPNRPEPHHSLPPAEHRSSGNFPGGNSHASQGQPQTPSVGHHGSGASPSTGHRR